MFDKKDDVPSWSNEMIQAFMMKVMEMPNFCDRIQEILKNEKEYERSNFYKETKITLVDLYKNYRQDQLLSPEVFLNYIQENINKLDLTNLKKVLSAFNEETDKTYKDAIDGAEKVGIKKFLEDSGVIK
jgi:hypothetical protein